MNRYQLAAYSAPSAAAASDADQQTAAGKAVEWLRDKWRAFVALDVQMQDLQHRWAQAGAAALAAGDTAANEQAKQAIARIGELRQLHGRALEMFDALASQLPPLQGLGQVPLVPLALAGTVLALAAMVTYIFSRVADEAERAPGSPGIIGAALSLGDTLKWVAGAAAVIVALNTLNHALGRRRGA